MLGCDLYSPPREPSAVEQPYDSAAIVAATTDYSVDPEPESFIGLGLQPWPAGVDDIGGGVLQNREGSVGASFILHSVRVRGRPMLWLAEVTGRTTAPRFDADGRQIGSTSAPVSRVADVVLLPPLYPGERVQWRDCEDPSGQPVIAYVRVDQSVRHMGDVRLAWRADFDQQKLLTTSPVGVRCVNAGFGMGRS